MVEFEMSRLSSKGQVVIPTSMRKDMKEGDKIIFIRSGKNILIKKASEMDKQFNEDLEFARRTEEAYKRIEAGEGITMDFDDFIKEMKKW
jgi:AbrB family looped-hinge helix DNA binding protein